ncbi:hypothetical protein BCEP4_630022 [Burkholderia cepacia]|nr:hypothetical protein BCEP4_630022 [Burkholderia cepacia]
MTGPGPITATGLQGLDGPITATGAQGLDGPITAVLAIADRDVVSIREASKKLIFIRYALFQFDRNRSDRLFAVPSYGRRITPRRRAYSR